MLIAILPLIIVAPLSIILHPVIARLITNGICKKRGENDTGTEEKLKSISAVATARPKNKKQSAGLLKKATSSGRPHYQSLENKIVIEESAADVVRRIKQASELR